MKNYSITFNGTDPNKRKFYYALNSESAQEVILRVWNQYIEVLEYETRITIEPGKVYFSEVFSKTRDRFAEFRDVKTFEVVGMFSIDGMIGVRDIDYKHYIKKILPSLNEIERRDLNFIFNEVFTSDMYNSDFISIEKGDTVFDIGFNYGMFSLLALHKEAGKIIGFEPNKKLSKLFLDNCFDSPIELHQLALSNENGETLFYENEWPGKSSIFDSINEDTQKDSYLVEIKNFADFLSENNIEKIDYLKIDCEGAEYDIFASIPNDFLKNKIKKIAIEFHHKLTDKRVYSLIEKLRIASFEIKSAYTDGAETGMIYARKLN